MSNTTLLLYVLAVVAFALAAFNIPKVSWRDVGFALLVISLILK